MTENPKVECFSSTRTMEEVGYGMEDDLYFADLSKQISMLIMDDDDDQMPVGTWKYSSALQGFSRTLAKPSLPPPSVYEEHCRRSETSKGTGVFIPKLSQPPRMRNRQEGGGRGGGRRRRLTSSSKSHNNDMIHHCIYNRSAPGDFTPKKI